MSNSAQCRSCEAPIMWGINVESGKGIPLDPTPVTDGAIVEVYDNLVETNNNQLPVRHVRNGEQVESWMTRYNTHFSTCPDADDWREKRNNRSARR